MAHSFLGTNSVPSHGWTTLCLSSHSPTKEHLGILQFGATVNEPAVRIHEQDFVWAYVFKISWANTQEGDCYI